MFEGKIGKDMMIQQGYAPSTCTLPVELAGPLIWAEVNAGRLPCDGCEHDRAVCKGNPKKPKIPSTDLLSDLVCNKEFVYENFCSLPKGHDGACDNLPNARREFPAASDGKFDGVVGSLDFGKETK